MAYKKIKLSNNGKKAFQILMQELKISMSEAQKLIDKKRLFCNEKLVEKKNEILNGVVELIVYEAMPKGAEICFENDEFVVLEKPSGVLSHPNGRHCEYSLYDEIYSLWGQEACVAHRLDKQTSGLILVAKNKETQIKLKTLFEKKQIQKEYLALVRGKTKQKFSVNLPLALAKNYDDVKMRMQVCEDGKESFSEFERLEFFENLNASLIICRPKTGRQHQLRIHLFAINHAIFGEYLYGFSKEEIEAILDEKLTKQELIKLTGASRLLLHACRLKFSYKNENFDLVSKTDVKNEFFKSMY